MEGIIGIEVVKFPLNGIKKAQLWSEWLTLQVPYQPHSQPAEEGSVATAGLKKISFETR